MASSPQYLAPSAQNPEHIDIDPSINTLPGGSCSTIAPSTAAYSTSDQTSYSEVSRISPFDTSPVIDDNLLTPVSSAASPQLQHRSCKQSPFLPHEELTPCSQQPTPPNSAAMYSYPDYTTSSMPMQTTVTEAPHELLPYLQHSPGQDDPPPPPPQSQPYFDSYSVSVPGPHEPAHDHYYLQNGTIDNPLGLIRPDMNGGSYTHRPLAPMTQAGPMATMLHPSHPPQYRRELMALPRMASAQNRHSSLSVRRDPGRKAKARRSRRESFSPPTQPQFRFGEQVMKTEDDGPDEELILDEDTPADLKRLWDTRRKWETKKGNGMWEDIVGEYLGEDNLREDKKTQVKAALQMRIHRMLLKHGVWPARDKAALLRAYKRWEEDRYNQLLRLFEEEMTGYKKGYEWKSQHIEVQLVKMGLEQPERDRDSKARKRKQVAARHQARASVATRHAAPMGPPQQRLPAMYEPTAAYGHSHQHQHQPQHPYGHGHGHGHGQPNYDARFEVTGLAEQLGVQPPALTDEQQERLIDEVLERTAFEDEAAVDHDGVPMPEDYGGSSGDAHSHGHGLPATVTPGQDVNAQRSAAVARGACAELIKQQHFGPGVGA